MDDLYKYDIDPQYLKAEEITEMNEGNLDEISEQMMYNELYDAEVPMQKKEAIDEYKLSSSDRYQIFQTIHKQKPKKMLNFQMDDEIEPEKRNFKKERQVMSYYMDDEMKRRQHRIKPDAKIFVDSYAVPMPPDEKGIVQRKAAETFRKTYNKRRYKPSILSTTRSQSLGVADHIIDSTSDRLVEDRHIFTNNRGRDMVGYNRINTTRDKLTVDNSKPSYMRPFDYLPDFLRLPFTESQHTKQPKNEQLNEMHIQNTQNLQKVHHAMKDIAFSEHKVSREQLQKPARGANLVEFKRGGNVIRVPHKTERLNHFYRTIHLMNDKFRHEMPISDAIKVRKTYKRAIRALDLPTVKRSYSDNLGNFKVKKDGESSTKYKVRDIQPKYGHNFIQGVLTKRIEDDKPVKMYKTKDLMKASRGQNIGLDTHPRFNAKYNKLQSYDLASVPKRDNVDRTKRQYDRHQINDKAPRGLTYAIDKPGRSEYEPRDHEDESDLFGFMRSYDY